MATAARAWVGAELPLEELASAFSDALPSTAAHRRALLLTGFVRAAGLTASLRLLLALHPTNVRPHCRRFLLTLSLCIKTASIYVFSVPLLATATNAPGTSILVKDVQQLRLTSRLSRSNHTYFAQGYH